MYSRDYFSLVYWIHSKWKCGFLISYVHVFHHLSHTSLNTLLLVIFLAGFSLAMFPVDNPIPSDGFTFIVSPITLVINMSCLNFQYYLRSNLRVYISNSSLSKTVADFHVDGGFDFHRAFIDLRPGKYQIIWETQWDQTPMEVVRNYRAAIDDVQITSGCCEDLRKYILVMVVKSMSFGVNQDCFKTPCDCFQNVIILAAS